jgi:hypothetical protein
VCAFDADGVTLETPLFGDAPAYLANFAATRDAEVPSVSLLAHAVRGPPVAAC